MAAPSRAPEVFQVNAKTTGSPEPSHTTDASPKMPDSQVTKNIVILEVSAGDRLFDAREVPRKLGNLTPGSVRATALSKARSWQAPCLHHNSTANLSASCEQIRSLEASSKPGS